MDTFFEMTAINSNFTLYTNQKDRVISYWHMYFTIFYTSKGPISPKIYVFYWNLYFKYHYYYHFLLFLIILFLRLKIILNKAQNMPKASLSVSNEERSCIVFTRQSFIEFRSSYLSVDVNSMKILLKLTPRNKFSHRGTLDL